jgi:hypothetical protein
MTQALVDDKRNFRLWTVKSPTAAPRESRRRNLQTAEEMQR